MLSEAIKAKAISALDGMREIARAEMLEPGRYIWVEISNPRRVNAICGGHKTCAIGSLWVGAGIKMDSNDELPGADQSEREAFLAPRHGLRVAYESLNEAAEAFIAKHPDLRIGLAKSFDAPIEQLFEGHYGERRGGRLTRGDLLQIISHAKRLVMARDFVPDMRVLLIYEDGEPATIQRRWGRVITDKGRKLDRSADEMKPIPVELLQAAALAHADQGIAELDALIGELEGDPERFAAVMAKVPDIKERWEKIRGMLDEVRHDIEEGPDA